MRMKKRILFQREAKTQKNGQTQTKNEYGVNSPLVIFFLVGNHVNTNNKPTNAPDLVVAVYC